MADLQTIPEKPIVPVTIDQARALQLAKPSPSPTPVPTATPVPPPIPTPIPTPTPLPPVKPEPEAVKEHWTYQARGGAHGTATYFKGSNFQATEIGGTLGDYRLFVTPPKSKTDWRFEAEFQTENLQVANSAAFPFQNTLTTQTFRLTAIKESPYQGDRSWGLSALNENYVFQRADVETLSVQTPWSAGPFYDWRWVYDHHETEYRLGVYLGTATSLEARATRTYFLQVSNPLDLTLTLDSKITAGVTTSGSYWSDGTVYIFLGVRWK